MLTWDWTCLPGACIDKERVGVGIETEIRKVEERPHNDDFEKAVCFLLTRLFNTFTADRNSSLRQLR